MARTPVDVLLDETDPTVRARAHLTLGRTAQRQGHAPGARRHFREAARLAPADPEVMHALRSVGETTTAPPRVRRWLFGRRR